MWTLILLLFLQGPTRSYRGNPNDDPELAGQRIEYEADVKMPKSGKIAIPFFPGFKLPPSCSIANKTNPKRPIYAEDATATDHIILKGKAGDVAHYACHGIGLIKPTSAIAAKRFRPEIQPKDCEMKTVKLRFGRARKHIGPGYLVAMLISEPRDYDEPKYEYPS